MGEVRAGWDLAGSVGSAQVEWRWGERQVGREVAVRGTDWERLRAWPTPEGGKWCYYRPAVVMPDSLQPPWTAARQASLSRTISQRDLPHSNSCPSSR